jgi:uncharacterized protein YmfQ (DUF2313 family)
MVARSGSQYRQLLQALLPSGPIWPRDADATLTRVLGALAQELARVDARLEDLRGEADPRTTWEMLSDWEELCGLPGECWESAATMALRRAAVVTHLTFQGNQTPAFYIDLAAQFGHEITIEEFAPFRAGSRVGDPLYGEDWAHAWRVWIGAATPVTHFRAGRSGAGERLASWGDDDLECLIEALQPAHTVVLFGYLEEE